MKKQIEQIIDQGNERRSRGKMYLSLILVFVAVCLFTFLTQRFKDNDSVNAANSWTFDAGYIMSDWQMANYKSMSEADIQNFLTSKNPCNNRDWALYDEQSNKYPGVSWHWSGDHFVCLSEERFGDGTTIGSGESAAHIIWRAAQDYRINPQVLIVLLEKENGLITDTFPHSGQYKTATGFDCPDTGPCDPARMGFKNQIRLAASLFREVLDGGWSTYPVGVNYVQYNPSKSCGGTYIDIKNRATSALYRYTPYQPNNSALAAGYGTGDGCGAYGNRNFYLWFEDWFGGIKDEEYTMPASANISEGTYIIKSAINNKKVVDISGGSKSNYANVQLYDRNDSGAQKWQIKNNGDGTYTLVNPQSGKALDVSAASKERGANTQIYENNSTCAQKWRIANSGGDNYTLYSACSGMPLDVNAASTANGTNIQVYAPNSTNAQKWKLEKEQPKVEDSKADALGAQKPIAEGTYTIRSAVNQNMTVDIKNGAEGAAGGTNIQLYTSNGTNAQKWKFKYNSDGTYTIINPTSNKAIDVVGAGKTNYTNVHLYAQNNTCAQKWKATKNVDGSFIFKSACSDLALDLSGALIYDGNNIQIYSSNGTNAQKWYLKQL